MLTEFLKRDHGQETGASPASSDDMERGRSLADFLAITAGELFTHVLNDFPAARDGLKGLGHVLTQFAQPIAAATSANRRPGTTMRSRGRCSGKGLRAGRLREKAATLVVLATACSAAISSSAAEAQVPRAAAPSGRAEDAPCVPTAGRRLCALASRSLASDGRSAPDPRRPWLLQPQPLRSPRSTPPSGFNVVGNQTSIHAFE